MDKHVRHKSPRLKALVRVVDQHGGGGPVGLRRVVRNGVGDEQRDLDQRHHDHQHRRRPARVGVLVLRIWGRVTGFCGQSDWRAGTDDTSATGLCDCGIVDFTQMDCG